MQEQAGSAPNSLVTIVPEISTEELMGQLRPPPEFSGSSFSNYHPATAFPSQKQALEQAKQFVTGNRKLFGKQESHPGIYLDGGFGVGKTHLLAAMWHEFAGPKAFGSFLEYTSLIGYLGFQVAVSKLSRYRLICIDEFELDDPGDTMMMSRLLKELTAAGVKFAATSNTPPNALGQGRFAAEDFKREIQGLGERFKIVTIDGEDYRHRDTHKHARNLDARELDDWLAMEPDSFSNRFIDILNHLGTLHPTKYRRLLSNVGVLGITDVFQLQDQVAALRFVVFVDRAYEQQIPIRSSGDVPITDVFSQTMLEGGYRKKYLRAISRLGALSELY